MQQVTVNYSWRGAGKRVVFSVVAAAVALVAGFLLAAWVFLTFIALFAPGASRGPWLFVLWIPWLLWLAFFARSAAAKDSWVGAAKRTGFLVTATIAAFFAGSFLAALPFGALIVGYGVIHGGSLLSLLLIPLLLLLLAGAIAAVVWLARRSRISKLPWFLIGAGAFSTAWMAGFALIWFWYGGD